MTICNLCGTEHPKKHVLYCSDACASVWNTPEAQAAFARGLEPANQDPKVEELRIYYEKAHRELNEKGTVS
jgi:hypothetical protein